MLWPWCVSGGITCYVPHHIIHARTKHGLPRSFTKFHETRQSLRETPRGTAGSHICPCALSFCARGSASRSRGHVNHATPMQNLLEGELQTRYSAKTFLVSLPLPYSCYTTPQRGGVRILQVPHLRVVLGDPRRVGHHPGLWPAGGCTCPCCCCCCFKNCALHFIFSIEAPKSCCGPSSCIQTS